MINGYGKTTITVTTLETDNCKEAEKVIVKIVPKKTKFKMVKPKKWKIIAFMEKKGYGMKLSTDKIFKKDNTQRSIKKQKLH